jgi:uncharacterized membrane protein YphA (DoxX/SURF4 family)
MSSHSLRLSIFFLRIALGLNFVYLGWTALFDHPLGTDLRSHAMNPLYGWLAATPATGASFAWLPQVAAWAFLVVGILLILGLFTRLASLVAIVLILISYLPTISFASFNVAQLVNDELILFFCLLVLIFGRAGHYLGVDKFLRWSKKRKE